MNWLALLGLEELFARWHANLVEGAIAAEDRMELARLEWAQLRPRLAQLLLLTIAAAGLTVVALLMLSLALLVQFWDTPQRQPVAWLIAGLWVAAWAGAAVWLLALTRRAGNGFALTRRELAQDWHDLRERL